MALASKIKYIAQFRTIEHVSDEAKRFIYPDDFSVYISDCSVEDNLFHFTCLNFTAGKDVEHHFTAPLDDLDYLLEWVRKGYIQYQRKKRFSKEIHDFIEVDSTKHSRIDTSDSMEND